MGIPCNTHYIAHMLRWNRHSPATYTTDIHSHFRHRADFAGKREAASAVRGGGPAEVMASIQCLDAAKASSVRSFTQLHGGPEGAIFRLLAERVGALAILEGSLERRAVRPFHCAGDRRSVRECGKRNRRAQQSQNCRYSSHGGSSNGGIVLQKEAPRPVWKRSA